MAFTELEALIDHGLIICGAGKVERIIAYSELAEESQQWEMAEYLEKVVDNPPPLAEIMAKVKEIAEA